MKTTSSIVQSGFMREPAPEPPRWWKPVRNRTHSRHDALRSESCTTPLQPNDSDLKPLGE